jgi:hypothetical protein
MVPIATGGLLPLQAHGHGRLIKDELFSVNVEGDNTIAI